ncbi:MAG: response regulator transcription factor [Acidaminobacteraceae bacterium]
MIKVLLVDDQEIISQGLSMVLSMNNDIEIVSSAKDGREAISLTKKYMPDVILMDIQMPLLNGVEAIKLIKRDYKSVKIIILTTFNDDEYIYDGVRSGASGYLLKDTPPSDIASAIRTVYSGGSIIQPSITTKLLKKFSEMTVNAGDESCDSSQNKLTFSLTKRERDIVKLVAHGKNNNEISEVLFISEGTVKNNLTRVLNKLNLRDRTQLAIYALRNRLD